MPGSGVGHHVQKEDEIYYVLSGKGTMVLDGKTVDITPGTQWRYSGGGYTAAAGMLQPARSADAPVQSHRHCSTFVAKTRGGPNKNRLRCD